MKKTLLVLVSFLFLSCTCMTATQKEKAIETVFNMIEIGMTIAEVSGLIKTMPDFIVHARGSSTDKTTWEYPDFQLVFIDGKLSEKRMK